MKPKTLLQAFREFLSDNTRSRQHHRIEKATRKMAEHIADAEFERTMANFYTERVISIDPHVGPAEAWDFAAAKQKQYDHQNDCISYEQKAEAARAEVAAHIAKLHRLQQSTALPGAELNQQ